MAVGYYLAITQSPDAHPAKPADRPSQGASPIAPIVLEDAALDTTLRGIRFLYRPLDPRASALTLRQESSSVPAEGAPVGLRTEISLRFEESLTRRNEPLNAPEDPDDEAGELSDMLGVTDASASVLDSPDARPISPDALAATRVYSDVHAAIFAEQAEASGALGDDISAQVAQLLDNATTRTFLQPNGEIFDFEWRNVPNPEARRILYLVRDAQAFLTPRFTADALNPGDTWSYERPLWVDPDDQRMHAEGTVTISNRFAGTLEVDGRHLGVIRQTLAGHAKGELRAGASRVFAMEGSGSGVFLVDLERGGRVAADLEFERTLRVEAPGEADGPPALQRSSIWLNLRPAEGLALPDALRAAHQVDAPEAAGTSP